MVYVTSPALMVNTLSINLLPPPPPTPPPTPLPTPPTPPDYYKIPESLPVQLVLQPVKLVFLTLNVALVKLDTL